MIAGHPGLRYLARRKLWGALRKQRRRLRRPANIVFAILGVLLFASWIGSLALGHAMEPDTLDPHRSAPTIQLIALVVTVMTVSSALTHRGLFLPREEIELLFSAPVTRAQLVRYRLLTNVGRSLPAGLMLGLVTMWRMPLPAFAFVGAFLATLTLPLVGQAVSLLTGSAENRFFDRVPRGGLIAVNVLGILLISLTMVLFFAWEGLGAKAVELLGTGAAPERLVRAPLVAGVTAVFRPWALMISAGDPLSFLKWFGVCLGAWFALLELTCRIPVDFRELSLQTSSDVARRLNRVRRGRVGASASRAKRGPLGWRVPWFLGRNPVGALAWRKTASILRKARGTLFVSGFVLLGLTALTSALDAKGSGMPAYLAPALVVLVGTVYLSAGLRFDFRDDYDHLEVIKSWPLGPTSVFLGTILPQVLLISVLVWIALLLRVALAQEVPLLLLLALPVVPLITLAWVAVDNAVFLLAPVRPVPGQDGALQHMGRTMVLMIVRLSLFVAIGTMVSLAASLPFLLGLRDLLGVALGAGLGVLVLALDVGLLVLAGGAAFRRFDLARDRA